MIDRYAVGAGVAAALIYGVLYLAYGVTQGWDLPTSVAIGFGVGVVLSTTITTEFILRRLAAGESSKEV